MKTFTPLNRATVLTAVASLAAATALAFDVEQPPLDSAALEEVFWQCDVRATQEALPAGDGALCAMASDELKQRRFGGDFAALLAWWQSNKLAEHARRGTSAPEPEDLALQAP